MNLISDEILVVGTGFPFMLFETCHANISWDTLGCGSFEMFLFASCGIALDVALSILLAFMITSQTAGWEL